MSRPADNVRAIDGRRPGRRGRETRERLLECAAERLEKASYRDIKVTDIARCAQTSPATFYQYFESVEDAIFALAEDMASEGESLTEHVQHANWRGKAAGESALGLVDGFLHLWEEHRAVLRVVDLATLEGDNRFYSIRTTFLNHVTLALRDVIERFKADGRHPPDLDSMAHASSVVSMLAHAAQHRYGFEFWGIRTDDMRLSLARIVCWSVTGRRPPD